MSNLNKVLLIGRLGADPEVQHFDSGVMKAKFSLATSESYLNRDGQRVENTEWHNIVMWRKNAEIAEKYLRKGKLVFIEGKIKTRSWEDEGGKHYITEIEAFSFKMLGSKDENSGAAGGGAYASSATTTKSNAQVNDNGGVPATANKPKEEVVDQEDDLPF